MYPQYAAQIKQTPVKKAFHNVAMCILPTFLILFLIRYSSITSHRFTHKKARHFSQALGLFK
jgi:hypothetical protein